MGGNMTDSIDEIKSIINETLHELNTLDGAIRKEKNENIQSMIKHYIALTDKMEDRRYQLYTSSLTYLSVLVALSGLLFLQANNEILQANTLNGLLLFTILWSFFITQLAYNTLIVYEYNLQSCFRYPFLRIPEYGNKWKWFYYGNKSITSINTRVLTEIEGCSYKLPYCETFLKDQKLYLIGLSEFSNHYVSETIETEIIDNIIYLYLLQVHNYYKNRFYLDLIGIRLRSFSVTLFILIFSSTAVILLFYVGLGAMIIFTFFLIVAIIICGCFHFHI
jgi:hypothetical protein